MIPTSFSNSWMHFFFSFYYNRSKTIRIDLISRDDLVLCHSIFLSLSMAPTRIQFALKHAHLDWQVPKHLVWTHQRDPLSAIQYCVYRSAWRVGPRTWQRKRAELYVRFRLSVRKWSPLSIANLYDEVSETRKLSKLAILVSFLAPDRSKAHGVEKV